MESLKQRLEALRDQWRADASPIGGGQRVGTGMSPSSKAVSRNHADALDAIIATMGEEQIRAFCAEPLDLVETGALIDALFRRNACTLIVLRPEDNPDTEPTVSYDGGVFAAIGMAEVAKDTLKGELD